MSSLDGTHALVTGAAPTSRAASTAMPPWTSRWDSIELP